MFNSLRNGQTLFHSSGTMVPSFQQYTGAPISALSLQSSCRASRSTVSGYFLAGRDMTWWPVSAPSLLPPLLLLGPHLTCRPASICILEVTAQSSLSRW